MTRPSTIAADPKFKDLQDQVEGYRRVRQHANKTANWRDVTICGSLRERATTDAEYAAHAAIVKSLSDLHEKYADNPKAMFVLLNACSRSVGIFKDNGARVLLNAVNSMHEGFVARGQRSKNPFTRAAVACNYWGHDNHRKLARSILWRVKTPGTQCDKEAEASLLRMGLS